MCAARKIRGGVSSAGNAESAKVEEATATDATSVIAADAERSAEDALRNGDAEADPGANHTIAEEATLRTVTTGHRFPVVVLVDVALVVVLPVVLTVVSIDQFSY
jgi:hypothetical protein